jgi:uncharacterized membrane protein (UPF0136 family)
MTHSIVATLLSFYGLFLIVCGIASVIFIGAKAKTALISGSTSGLVSLLIAYLVSNQTAGSQIAGIVVALALFCVFAWRSTKTLFKIFELIPTQSEELKGKGLAFLIISLMAVVSMIVLILQVTLLDLRFLFS